MNKQYGYIFEEELEGNNYIFLNFSLYYALSPKDCNKICESLKTDLTEFFKAKKSGEKYYFIIIRRNDDDFCNIEKARISNHTNASNVKIWNDMQTKIEELLSSNKGFLEDEIFELYYEKNPLNVITDFTLNKKCAKGIINGTGISWEELHDDTIDTLYLNILSSKLSHLIQQYGVRKSKRGEPLLLESANIYANEYIFVKDLFLYPNILNFFLFELYRKIRKYVKEKLENKLENVVLIATSMTGTMLVSALLRYFYIFDEKCGIANQFLLHFGPLFNIESKGLTLNELNKKKDYIYVYDFMCEGTEWRFLKNHLQAHDIELKASFGVAIYDRPYHAEDGDENYGKNKITALVDVHDWEKDEKCPCKYSISYERKIKKN